MSLDLDVDEIFSKVTLFLSIAERLRESKMQALLEEIKTPRISRRELFLLTLQAGDMAMIHHCERHFSEAHYHFQIQDVKGIFASGDIENIRYILAHSELHFEPIAFLQAMRDACDHKRLDVVKLIFQHPKFEYSQENMDLFFKYAISDNSAQNLRARNELVQYFIFDKKQTLTPEIEQWLSKKQFYPVIKMFQACELHDKLSDKLDNKTQKSKLKI